MVIIGLIVLVIGLVIGSRIALVVGGVLMLIGLVLWLAAVPGPVGGYYY